LVPEVQREFLRRLPPEERLAGLSREEISAHLQKMRPGCPSRKGKTAPQKLTREKAQLAALL
jgi:hypothetical protein